MEWLSLNVLVAMHICRSAFFRLCGLLAAASICAWEGGAGAHPSANHQQYHTPGTVRKGYSNEIWY